MRQTHLSSPSPPLPHSSFSPCTPPLLQIDSADSIELEEVPKDEWEQYKLGDDEVFTVELEGTCIMSDQSDLPPQSRDRPDNKITDVPTSVYPSQVTPQT